MRKSHRIVQIVLLFAALVLVGWAQLAHADDIAAPSILQPILGTPADRFTPTDVAAAPPPGGLLSPAPPAFQRQPCQAGICGGSGALWNIFIDEGLGGGLVVGQDP
jgi:hypothetical protein